MVEYMEIIEYISGHGECYIQNLAILIGVFSFILLLVFLKERKIYKGSDG